MQTVSLLKKLPRYPHTDLNHYSFICQLFPAGSWFLQFRESWSLDKERKREKKVEIKDIFRPANLKAFNKIV